MERKKEKMMLQSLQRKQQMEEAKARKEIEAMQRKEKEREKEDERARKREEQAARRAQILEQHKLKKAVEEAEREGKPLDRHIEMMLKQQQQQQLQSQQVAAPKMRSQRVVRPRPKTIHVESGSVDLSDVSSLTSRSKKGSNSNLTGMLIKLSSLFFYDLCLRCCFFLICFLISFPNFIVDYLCDLILLLLFYFVF